MSKAMPAFRSLPAFRHVGRFGETVAQDQRVEFAAEGTQLDAFLLLGRGRLQPLHVEHHVALVQHLVVLEVVQQCVRHGVELGGEEPPCRARAAAVLGNRFDEGLQRQAGLLDLADHQLATAAPGGHDGEITRPRASGTSRRARLLVEVGAEEGEIDHRKVQPSTPTARRLQPTCAVPRTSPGWNRCSWVPTTAIPPGRGEVGGGAESPAPPPGQASSMRLTAGR